jgi:hypothetical protein
VKYKQDRSRRSGHKHSLNIQDYGGQRLDMGQRAVSMFVNIAGLLPKPESDYYRLLPPGARMAIDACRREAGLLQGAAKDGNDNQDTGAG